MAPIATYSDSPIIAAKADGATPQTAAPEQGPSSTGQQTSPATTTASSQSPYPQAQPGAAPAIPVPTSSAAQAYSSPIQPTPTQQLTSDGPPPPQPGAFPTPSGGRTHLPPPPKAGERFQPPAQTSAPQPSSVPYPQQMGIPPPTTSWTSDQRGTSAAAASSSPFAGAGAQTLSHPPGYHQNLNASELDRYQRSSVQDPEHQSAAEDTVWDAAKKWAQGAGEKLAAAESEVWKRINKD